jgi:hypothetical protein
MGENMAKEIKLVQLQRMVERSGLKLTDESFRFAEIDCRF